MKIYKDLTFNRTIIEKIDDVNSKYNNENYKLLGNIEKEKDKFYFVPLLIDLGNDKENINDVPWLIYNNKMDPEINHSYKLKEGDIIKMGNAIFQIKMIQINENENNAENKDNEKKKDIESNNNTILISGSANHSLILNKNYENVDVNIKRINVKKNTSIHTEKKNNQTQEEKPLKTEKIAEEKKDISKNNKNKICRICYQEEDDILLNPLIRPCKCSGSMKYIHLKCLLHWLKSRTSNNPMPNINNNNENFNAYFINQKTECELCKQLFPDYIKHNDIKYCIIDFDYAQENKIKENNNNINNEQNYANTNMDINVNNNKIKEEKKKNSFIVLDTLFPLADNNKYRYIVRFNENNEIKIGRGLDNQLILNEITVSRNHCLLTLNKNQYGNYEIKMIDEKSKFGTLILMQTEKIEIIKGKPLHLQISNIHLVFQYKKKNPILSCCNVDVVDEKNSYEKMNYKAVKSKNIVNILTEINSDDGGDNNDDNNKKQKKEENKDNKELKINKKSNGNIILLNNNNTNNNTNNKENMKTIPKDINDKKENIEKKDDKNINLNKDKDNNKDNNKDKNNEENHESVEIEEDNEKNKK